MPARRVPVRILPGCRGRVTGAELRRVARYVLNAEGVAPGVEVEVVLADAATVRGLSRLYRGRDEPTDVLSFASGEEAPRKPARPEALEEPALSLSKGRGPVFIEPPDAAPSLGEVVICLPVAEAQAQAAGRPVAGAVAHLLVHGLLHLLGYDHEASETDAARMREREEALLWVLGYEGAYKHGH